jgi:Family of unknown function (DUF6502)
MSNTAPAAQTPAGPPAALVAALRQALRPLVHLMLARGITYPYLAELLKGLFVDVAQQDFRLGDKPPTDSRVSLVSGVHRKDVARLRSAQSNSAQDARAPAVVSLGAQLVAHWLSSAQYLDEGCQPLALPRFASEGGARSFEALVASVNSDIRSRVVLDEWLRLGVVHLDDAQRVVLNTEAFVPAQGFEEKAFYLGHNLHDHAAAVVHNLLGQAAAPTEPARMGSTRTREHAKFQPLMERSVHYQNLPADQLPAIAKLAQQRGMQALLAVNKLAMQTKEAAQSSAQANPASTTAAAPMQRMTFGVYFYTEPVQTPADAASSEGPRS